ncbi:paraquat-inducible protein A [Aliiglaciecola sp. SL4]|uniref:paraquat-inducible protein A n=1 Tax=Aliiglaciecola sp. SL4 TaxID=3239806 RepID=UPI00355BBA05
MSKGLSDPIHSGKTVCQQCDTKVVIPRLAHRQKAKCPLCGHVLTQHLDSANQRIIMFAVSALIFLILSMPFNFLGFSTNGQHQAIGIISGLDVLIVNDYMFLAVVQLLSIVIVPAIVLTGLLLVLLPFPATKNPNTSKAILNVVYTLIPWSMAEIFLIGVLVSLIKISSFADISIGLSFYAYIGFTVCMVATMLSMDKHQLYITATDAQHSKKKLPKSESIQRTWALLLTSILLYIPANTLPIMHTVFLGTDEPSTILGGVISMWQNKSYPIALVIFVASIVVPIGKLVILIWLNYCVQYGTIKKQNKRIFWYRLTEFIGRWSMVDIFAVAILVSLIQLGNTMSVFPGPAALAFCAVVILTMLAAMTFDPRLIWSNSDAQNDR